MGVGSRIRLQGACDEAFILGSSAIGCCLPLALRLHERGADDDVVGSELPARIRGSGEFDPCRGGGAAGHGGEAGGVDGHGIVERDVRPRPFVVSSPSGADYGFFVQQKSECLLRLFNRQQGFTRYTNNLTYIATRQLDGCQCAE